MPCLFIKKGEFMATLNIQVKVNKADANDYTTTTRQKSMKNISNLMMGIASGMVTSSVDVNVAAADPVAAKVTATLTSCATDTITILGITFTGTATPTTVLHFETDGDDTADAAALAAAINAHPTLKNLVYATSAAAVVTITSLVKGVIGNYLQAVTETGTTIVVANSGVWAGGTGGVTAIPTTFAS
jgi:hypothetical protein